MSKQIAVASQGQYMTFTLDQQQFGIPIASVREIIQEDQITPLPHSPAYIKGVIDLRGEVIPVLDLRLKFSLEEKESTKETCIIIIISDSGDVGAVVDTVTEVLTFEQEQIGAAPSLSTSGNESFVMGVGKQDERMLLLLDISTLVSSSSEEIDLKGLLPS
jgi:purine-binding chemotaxis protein CheW